MELICLFINVFFLLSLVTYYVIFTYAQKTINFFTVVWIKEELDDAEFDAKIVPVVNPFLIKVNGLNGALIAKEERPIIDRSGSMEEIDVKEEPIQDDMVS